MFLSSCQQYLMMPLPTGRIFADLLDMYEEEDMPARHSTQSAYKSNLRRLRDTWGPTKIEWMAAHPIELQRWLRTLQTLPIAGAKPRDLSLKSKKNLKALLHRLFECAMGWSFLAMQRNPIDFVRLRGLTGRTHMRPVLTIQQYQRILEDPFLPGHCRVMVQLAMMTGMRVSEILGLRWEDVDFRRGVLSLRRGMVGKHEDELKTEASADYVPMHATLASVLKNWLRANPSVNGWLFESPRTGRPYHRDSLQADHLRPAGKRLGIKGLGWHSFRHTYRALLRDLETPLEVQQYLMRHASITTTMLYGKFGPGRVRMLKKANARVVEILPRAMGNSA